MTRLIFVLSTLLLFRSIVFCQEGRFIEKKKPVIKVGKNQKYTFGYLEVPENRSKVNSNKIKIPIYIFKSRSSKPKPDPIIYIVGGPGSSILNAVPYMNYYKYLDDRDFILFEQRGTAYSNPHLDCPEWAEAVNKSAMIEMKGGDSQGLLEEASKKCSSRLKKKGIDLDGYNTVEIAADVEALRKALGIEKYNLLTLSYGTKVAQVLMRDFPDAIRSVAMDSPLPLETNWDLESVDNVMSVYNTLFSDCEFSKECNKRYPYLRTRFFDFLQKCTSEPLMISVTDPKSKMEEQFIVKGEDIFYLIANSNSGDIPKLPEMIERILNADYEIIESEILELYNDPGKGEAMGMRIAVWCSEESAFISPEELKKASEKHRQIGIESTELFDLEICKIWGVKKADSLENQAIKSEIPTLLVSGEYDTSTPMYWAESMTKNLTSSHHVIFKGWQHTPTTYWDIPCGMQVANDFFNSPNVKPNPDCFNKIKAPKFVTGE